MMNRDLRFYSPLRYPGGKTCIFPFVSNLIKENGLIGISYAEPYAGGSGLALKLLIEEYVDQIFINDLDRSIYSFWNTIINQPELFCNWISNVEVSIENWYFYKEIQNNSQNVDELTLAKSTFFLNRTNISGVIKGGIIGGVKQEGIYKIDARFKKEELIRKIQLISKFKDRITVSNLDGLKFIAKMDKKPQNIFIYLDPPYYQKGADLYMNYYSELDHRKLSNFVHKLKNLWMVSYDNHEFILNLYQNENRVIHQLSQCASNRVGDEVLIFSPNIEFSNSIGLLKTSQIQ